MRKEFKIFSVMVVCVFVLSVTYNLNKLFNYVLFSQEDNETLFGLSYTIPLVVCGYMICKQARHTLEKIICKFFLWIAITSLCDEIIFDPFKPQIWEHFAGLIIMLTIIYTDARIKKNRT
jgi:drug/metabolite transporter superfamily protein YnfA